MNTPNPPKRFSMIREFHLADWFTLGNAFCGVGALFSVMSYLETGDIVHIYFATTGHTWTSHIKAMVTGWEEVEGEAKPAP